MNNLNTICGARSSIASQPAVNKLDSINRNPDIITRSKPVIISRWFEIINNKRVQVIEYAPQNEIRSLKFNNGYQRVKSDISFGFSELRNA